MYKQLLLAALLASPFALNAAPVTWTINSLNLTDGATGGGSFVYDIDTGIYSNVNVFTTVGTTYPAQTYSFPYEFNSGAFPDSSLEATNVTGDLTGQNLLAIAFTGILSNAGGTLDVLAGAENLCHNSDCSQFDNIRFVTGGEIFGEAVPIPAAAYLFGSALIGLVAIKRKRS